MSSRRTGLTAFQNYSAHRYSRLSQINRDTVGGLKVAFTMSLAGTVLNGRTEAQLEGYGLVDDGLMYFDGRRRRDLQDRCAHRQSRANGVAR